MLADGFEEIEALTVVDVLRRADIDIKTVSIKEDEFVVGRSNIVVKADYLIDDMDFDDEDMLILPGGMPGTLNLETNRKVQKLIKKFADDNKWIASICAAPSILGKANYLKGINATCYPGFEKFLEGANYINKKVVVSENFITSQGAGTAFDFAYEIVKVLKDDIEVSKLKESMIYYV